MTKPVLPLLLAVAWLTQSTLAVSATMVVPGYTGMDQPVKQVKSLRDLRFANIIEQQTDFSCGAAVMATLLRYGFNRPVTEADVIAGMMAISNPETVRKNGFSMLDMKKYAHSIGLRASGFLVDASRLAQLKLPAIVLLDVNGYKHFVILKSYTNDWVYLADPAVGNRTVTTDTFKKQWNGVLLVMAGKGYRRDTPLLGTAGVISARYAIADRAQPVPIAELLEFGFLRSDFF